MRWRETRRRFTTSSLSALHLIVGVDDSHIDEVRRGATNGILLMLQATASDLRDVALELLSIGCPLLPLPLSEVESVIRVTKQLIVQGDVTLPLYARVVKNCQIERYA